MESLPRHKIRPPLKGQPYFMRLVFLSPANGSIYSFSLETDITGFQVKSGETTELTVTNTREETENTGTQLIIKLNRQIGNQEAAKNQAAQVRGQHISQCSALFMFLNNSGKRNGFRNENQYLIKD